MSTLNPNDFSFSNLSNSLSDYTPTTEESGLSTTASSSIFNDNETFKDVDENEDESNEKFHDCKIRLSVISLRDLPETTQTNDLPSRLSITSMNDDTSSEEVKFINYQSLKNITNDIYDYVQVVTDSDSVTKRKKSRDLFKKDKSVQSKNVGKKRKKKVKLLKASWKDESEKDREVAFKKVESLSVFDHNKGEMSAENLEIMENINLLHKLSHHQNLLRIFGYTVDPSTLNHFLIVQYANGGNLRKFLREHYLKLTWNDRLGFCKDLVNGLKYIHDQDVLHLALHSRNILHHNNKLLISDLGISKSHVSTVSLILPYTDPQYLADIANYQQNKQSDIYALGILMHEISSGRIPYDEYLVKDEVVGEVRGGGERDMGVSYLPELSPKIIHEDYRQQPVFGTPPEYVALYQQCWQMDPMTRPSVDKVLIRLDGIEIGPADDSKILKERDVIEERAKGENNRWDVDKIEMNNKEYNEKSDKDHVIYVQDVGTNSGTESGGSGLKSVYFSADITSSYPTDSIIYALADEESGNRKKRFCTRRRIVFSIFITWLAIIVVGGCVMIGVFASS